MTRSASAPARRMPGAKRERSPRHEHKLNRRHFVCVAVLALVLVGVVLVHVWLRLQVVKTGYVLATAGLNGASFGKENVPFSLICETRRSSV